MQRIISHTPLYVWTILAFLIHRANHEVEIGKICILPLAMLGLSLQRVHNNFGFQGAAPMLWAAGSAGSRWY